MSTICFLPNTLTLGEQVNLKFITRDELGLGAALGGGGGEGGRGRTAQASKQSQKQ